MNLLKMSQANDKIEERRRANLAFNLLMSVLLVAFLCICGAVLSIDLY